MIGPRRSVYLKENLIAAILTIKRMKQSDEKNNTIDFDDLLRVEELIIKIRRAIWRGPKRRHAIVRRKEKRLYCRSFKNC